MRNRDAQRVLSYRWVIFAVMAAAYVFVYFHRLCPAVVADAIQAEFKASAGLLGVLASAYFYPYALMQLPAGLLSDSWGPRKTVTVFLMIAAVGGIFFGFAPSMWVAVAARVMVGIGVSMVFIPTMKLVSQWFRAGEFAFMAAILNVMGGVGALTAATPLALVSSRMGWRGAFEIIGVGTLIVGILVWIIVRNRPADMGLPSLAEIDRERPGAPPPPQQIPLWEGARSVVTELRFWPLAIWFFFTCGVFFAFSGLWAGPYLMHVYGMTRAEAGSILNMTAVGMIIGSPLLSFVSEKVFHSRKIVLGLVALVLTAVVLLLYLFPAGLSRPMLYAVFFLVSVSSSSIVVIAFTSTKELFPVEIAGTSVGTVNLFPFLGGAVMQIALGKVLDAWGKNQAGAYPLEAYSALLLVLLAAAVIALVSTFLMKETFPVKEAR